MSAGVTALFGGKISRGRVLAVREAVEHAVLTDSRIEPLSAHGPANQRVVVQLSVQDIFMVLGARVSCGSVPHGGPVDCLRAVGFVAGTVTSICCKSTEAIRSQLIGVEVVVCVIR